MRRRSRWIVGVAAGSVLLAAGLWSTVRGGTAGPPASAHLAGTEEFVPGVAADVYLPSHTAAAPVVVLVPGGGWQTADRSGLAPLAEALAADGMLVVNATYRVAGDGVLFPVPVQDVECAVAFAVNRARQAGVAPSRVVLVGHSSGAHIAALAALGGPRFSGRCDYPAATVDGFVGLAGAYDIRALAELAEPLFGAPPDGRPDLWREADPATWAGERTHGAPLRVLLVHGDADDMVPVTMSRSFADELRRAGQPADLAVAHGATHSTIYRAEVVEHRIRDWVLDASAR